MHMLCSLGTGNYQEVNYGFRGKSYRTRFAPVALAQHLALSGSKATVLITAAAKEKNYPAMAADLQKAGLQPTPLELSEGKNEEDILRDFDKLVGAVSEEEPVVLDVTFSLRHLPFVYLAALTYLSALRGARIQGIYYGAYELKDETTGEAPILNLTVLFRLTEWYHAIESMEDSGNLRQIAQSLKTDIAKGFQLGHGDRQLSKVKRPLSELASALSSGLPLEAGLAARDLKKALQALGTSRPVNVMPRLALDKVQGWLQNWASSEEASDKENYPLTLPELKRQLELARWYLRCDNAPASLLQLREWLVSFQLFRRNQTGSWLDYNRCRHGIETYLNGLSERAKAGLATETEKESASLWDRTATVRNEFAHAGMTTKIVKIDQSKVEGIIRGCESLLGKPEVTSSGVTYNAHLPTSSRLLVSPLGFSPGVLYSAVCRVRPQRLLVVTSAEARSRLQEALVKANAGGLSVEIREMADPHLGFKEISNLIDTALGKILVGSTEVVVNLTGGTTAIQYAVERIADEAHRLGAPVRRVAVVDKRDIEQQRESPYVLGELVEVDKEETQEAGQQ